jgi:hypothetical protein
MCPPVPPPPPSLWTAASPASPLKILWRRRFWTTPNPTGSLSGNRRSPPLGRGGGRRRRWHCSNRCVTVVSRLYGVSLTTCYGRVTPLRRVSHYVLRLCHVSTAFLSLRVTFVSRLHPMCLTSCYLCVTPPPRVPHYASTHISPPPTPPYLVHCVGCPAYASFTSRTPYVAYVGLLPSIDPLPLHPDTPRPGRAIMGLQAVGDL